MVQLAEGVGLAEQFGLYFTMYVRQTIVTPRVLIREFFMVKTK